MYFGADTRDQVLAKARDVYTGHYEAIREKCRRENRELLEYELGEGWEPLAAFFGVPTPVEPFPHVNEKEEMRKHQRDTMLRELRRGLRLVLYYILPALALLAGLALSRN